MIACLLTDLSVIIYVNIFVDNFHSLLHLGAHTLDSNFILICTDYIFVISQSSRVDFMLRRPNCTDKHQMLIILTNRTSDI